MYGLIEAAAQVRQRGQLIAAKGAPATAMRGVRLCLQPSDLQADWYNSPAHWQEFFRDTRPQPDNRLTLVYRNRTLAELAEGGPAWRCCANISEAAAEHAIDLVLGVETLPAELGANNPLKRLLDTFPKIRAVQASFGADAQRTYRTSRVALHDHEGSGAQDRRRNPRFGTDRRADRSGQASRAADAHRRNMARERLPPSRARRSCSGGSRPGAAPHSALGAIRPSCGRRSLPRSRRQCGIRD